MFYKLPAIKGLMKKAYNGGGLVVGLTETGWLYTAGGYWCICQDIENTPKEFKAAVVELAGDIPEPGSCFRAFKDGGNQFMFDQSNAYLLPNKYGDISIRGAKCEETDIVLTWYPDPVRIILPETGEPLRIIKECAYEVVSRESIDHENGETDILGPFVRLNKDPVIIWHNDDVWFMVMIIHAGEDNKKSELLHCIAGALGTTVFEPLRNTLQVEEEPEEEDVEGHSETV